MRKSIMLLMLLVGIIIGQDNPVRIPKGSRVKLLWIAPPDTDVVKYRLYYTQDACDSLDFSNWYVANDSTSQCNTILTLPLKLGFGYVELAAIDLAANMSLRSNKAYFTIYDPPPGSPLIIELRVP